MAAALRCVDHADIPRWSLSGGPGILKKVCISCLELEGPKGGGGVRGEGWGVEEAGATVTIEERPKVLLWTSEKPFEESRE